MLSNDRKLIAVIGATGQQGGGVVRALQASGEFKVRALTRNPLIPMCVAFTWATFANSATSLLEHSHTQKRQVMPSICHSSVIFQASTKSWRP